MQKRCAGCRAQGDPQSVPGGHERRRGLGAVQAIDRRGDPAGEGSGGKAGQDRARGGQTPDQPQTQQGSGCPEQQDVQRAALPGLPLDQGHRAGGIGVQHLNQPRQQEQAQDRAAADGNTGTPRALTDALALILSPMIEIASGEFRAVWDSGDEKRHRHSIRLGILTLKPISKKH